MSAVWRVARAAVRRRRLQTYVIALVVLFSTATIVVALGLLDASSGPFDRAFAEQRGPHVVATYSNQSPPTDAADAEAVAGPFGQLVLDVPADGGPVWATGPITVVGRADPAGPVDRVDLFAGRWATSLNEAVVNTTPPPQNMIDSFAQNIVGQKIAVPGRPQLTIVGVAYSLSDTADAWVSPATMAQLGPTAAQVLYRFRSATTAEQVDAATAGLPRDGLLGTRSYLTQKAAIAAGPGTILPFLVVFGVLGLITAVLIVANVISGAVVSGFRHIGVLKALGYTPRQVVLVYLVMVTAPATAGAIVGTVLGTVAARPLLHNAFQGLGFGGQVQTGAWVPLTGILAVPALVVLTALVPASSAHRLSAAEAISAGSAPKAGRGLRLQRALAGARLPRAISLGLGLPFARPGRTGLTMAALLLGVTTVTLAGGLAASVIRYGHAVDRADAVQVQVRPNNPSLGNRPTDRTDPQVESLLRGLPGTTYVTADLPMQLTAVGHSDPVVVDFLRGDSATIGYQDQLVEGRWMAAADEVVASSAALHDLGARVGDRLELTYDGRHAPVRIVGKTMEGAVGNGDIFADWRVFTTLAPDYHLVNHEVMYYIRIASDTSVASYLAAIHNGDPGLYAWPANAGLGNSFTVSVVAISIVFSTMIGIVAALSVFNTVLLNVRERRRDLGTLKSIGMTPRQVVTMMVTSTAALGAAAGIPSA
ncbi:ABC transporter permease [Micromonospora sp. WP24]|uniref:ABC transporter permease n=1 Tax=Micromonospora sp. WP24 TaxID=2604469 RepID=UPI0011DA3F37|nr:FtsX family ABC transporter permease [Micromonospora sp. WP24]TYB95048.1 ABC transporter permease [Micromonospora sp. WP24]